VGFQGQISCAKKQGTLFSVMIFALYDFWMLLLSYFSSLFSNCIVCAPMLWKLFHIQQNGCCPCVMPTGCCNPSLVVRHSTAKLRSCIPNMHSLCCVVRLPLIRGLFASWNIFMQCQIQKICTHYKFEEILYKNMINFFN